ncbi:MAG: DEAD/DEAH box helicase, partial [Candidatus Njordarchaeales archaeon]
MHRESSVPIDEIHFLPKIIRNALKNSGIEFLRSFQLKGIQAGIDGDNLVISAPTGSGKTLIAEIIAVYN